MMALPGLAAHTSFTNTSISTRQLRSCAKQNTHSNCIGAASAATAGGFLQVAVSKAPSALLHPHLSSIHASDTSLGLIIQAEFAGGNVDFTQKEILRLIWKYVRRWKRWLLSGMTVSVEFLCPI